MCGLTTSNISNKYQDDDFILDHKLLTKRIKTGLYEFEHLVSIHQLDDLSRFKK